MTDKPRIAYVRSQELVYGYMGTAEARSKYQEKQQQWQANLDTLNLTFRNSVFEYKAKSASLKPNERIAEEEKLSLQESQLQQYHKAIEEKAVEEDNAMMQAVLNQINSFVEDYGEAHDYDVILGTTSSGSILYAEEGLDITEELINALNKNYRGE